MGSKESTFKRIIDLEGRVRLPDYLFDDYQTCFISLGLFSNTYLQLTPDGVYVIMSDQLGEAPVTDIKSFRMQRNLHTSDRLKMDEFNRIMLPKRLLDRVGINFGDTVIGQAINTSLVPGKPSYWTLQSEEQFCIDNPAKRYIVDVLPLKPGDDGYGY